MIDFIGQKWDEVKPRAMVWSPFRGARQVMDEGERSEWMKMSKCDEQKGKKGNNTKKITKH